MSQWERSSSRFANARALVLVLIASLLGTGSASGQSDDNVLGPLNASVSMPDFGARTAGFDTSISVSETKSVGYTSVKITCSSKTQLSADRRLVFRFRTLAGGETPPRNGLVVNIPILFRQGTTSESFVRFLPKWSAGQALEIQVLEDGRELPGYIGFVGQPRRFGRGTSRNLLAQERALNWIYLSEENAVAPATIPDLRAIKRSSDVSWTTNLTMDPITPEETASWKSAALGPELLAIGQKGLPTDWRAYQQYDVIITNQKAVDQLATRDQELRAIRHWMLHGGTILVYDAASIDSVLNAIGVRRTLDTDLRSQIAAVAGEMNYYIELEEKTIKTQIEMLQRYIRAYAGTERPNAGDDGTVAAVYLDSDLMRIHNSFAGDIQAVRDEVTLEQTRLDEFSKIPRYATTKWVEQVWMQSTGAGNVIGIKDSDEYDVPPLLHWKVATRSIGYRASPMLRRGVDPMIGDRRFSRWLIPGVAQPPVYTFMALLTAFVVLVGPVAYRRTAKQGRSYLMFAIAPALALLTTVAMFGYGIVSDGFSTVVRARQLTWVDGKSGDAGERVRATYFAGVRPQDGLRFAPDAEVFHYPEGTGRSWREANELSASTLGSVTVREDAQVFDSSFLPSRQQRQFVIHGPRANAGFLRLASSDDLNAPRRVENGFDFLIHEVIIRDRRGNYWHAEELAGGQTATCRPLSQKETSKMLGRLYIDHRPISEVRETGESKKSYSSEVYDILVDINRQMKFDSVVSDGIFEEWLQKHLQEAGNIPAEHFVATADVSEDVLATESEPVSSIRYVFGTLR